MKMNAAILWEPKTDWSVEEVELDSPKRGEVLVKLVGSGLCHSDEHLLTGDLVLPGRDAEGTGHPAAPRDRWSRGRGRDRGGGSRGLRAGGRRPRGLRVHPVVRAVPELRDRPSEPLRPRAVPVRRPAGLRHDGASPRPRPGPRADVLHRDVRRVHGGERGELHQDRGRHPARQGGPRRLRRHDGMGLGRLRRRGAARRVGRRHRLRRGRHERRPGRGDGRSPPRRRRRPGGVQARAGAGVRGDALGAEHRGGERARQRPHMGRDGEQGDHHGRSRRRRVRSSRPSGWSPRAGGSCTRRSPRSPWTT